MEQSSDEQIATIEITIEQAKHCVDCMTSMENLLKNPDFKKVFLIDYLEREPVRLVKLKCDVNQSSPESQAAIDKEMIGIGMLDQYIRYMFQRGNQALSTINDNEEARDEILNEIN